MTNRIARPLVIVPTYNERENLQELLPEILRVDPRLHILVVDDASPDGTAVLAQQLISTTPGNRLFLETRPAKLGLAGAYIHGFNWGLARGYDFLIEMDADWSHQPKYLKEMLALAPDAGFVIGSRYVPGGGTLNWGLARKLLSRFGSRYARWVLGVEIADFTGGFNGWHADVIRKVSVDSIRSEGYSFQIELKCRAAQLGFTYKEFPILFDERRAGKSKMSAAIACEAVWRIWTFRRMARDSKRQPGLRHPHL
ncbi:MAG TPA: polyprenol monophosphomannose synthase [Terriglobia bacterium]|nr:polyprenol monophosphomannose synthase [Terriglobia bacterium]